MASVSAYKTGGTCSNPLVQSFTNQGSMKWESSLLGKLTVGPVTN